MSKNGMYDDHVSKTEKSSEKRRSMVLFVFIIVLYAVAYFFTMMASRSSSILTFGDSQIALSAFAGVFSSLGNLLMILLVVLFKKRGFITALVILVGQTPVFVMGILVRNNLSSLPGFFVNILTIVVIIAIYSRNKKIETLQSVEIRYLTKQKQLSQRLFEQTATALVNAIDAKDTYSRGHSVRVAEYSEKIAWAMGKDDDECYKIYYTALLHDVGKIGISDAIINKKGKLTDEEYEAIKQHPVLGNQILSSISEYPYLSIGAHFHHERYDGRGYPDKLKGDDIPEIARIIAVADAYDAMTSTRSYRKAIPQQLVREEIVKNAGTQFDPEVAKIMQHIIDLDSEYQMKERTTIQELAGKSGMYCDAFASEISEGIILIPIHTKIGLDFKSEAGFSDRNNVPALILFDSLDGRVHKDDGTEKDLNYFQFGLIHFDGRTECDGARKMLTNVAMKPSGKKNVGRNGVVHYELDAVRFEDHALIKIDDGETVVEVTVALPDCTRYCYAGLTGEMCQITSVCINKDQEAAPVKDGDIPRIAEKVSFINVPERDIPNVQIDGFRSASSSGIPVTDGLTIRFHSMSLPTARLIWHCPYISIFHSEDASVNGEGFLEYALIRIDGENWHGEGASDNKLEVDKTSAFTNWEEWKKANKQGIDVEMSFERSGNTIIVKTENLGLRLKNTTTINDGNDQIFVALTGDQCAITNIRIEKPEEQ